METVPRIRGRARPRAWRVPGGQPGDAGAGTLPPRLHPGLNELLPAGTVR